MLIVAGAAIPLIAQESDAAQKSGFIRFVEDQLSTPERQIALNGLEGALSSDVKIAEITLSDSEGVWLRIDNAQLNWSQAALLTGRLQINSLSADQIEYIRASVPAEGITPPSPEAPSIAIPELPVAVLLESLSIPQIVFGEDLFGLGSEISLTGRLELQGGSLDTQLDIERQDGPGGTLSVAFKYDRESENVDIDLALSEPPDGVLVNLLDMDGKPELALSVTGSGALAALETNLTLDAGGNRALTGVAQIARAAAGLNIAADLRGPIADLVPSAYKSFFGAQTNLSASALIRDSGGFQLNNLTVEGGEISLAASADTAADGFLNRLMLDAQISSANGNVVLVPGGGATTGIESARLQIDYGNGDDWTGTLAINGLQTAEIEAQSIALNLNGAAINLSDPTNRRVTLNADGSISGIQSDDLQIAEALGTSMGIGIAGLWSAGEPITIAEARLRGNAFEMAATGTLESLAFTGDIALATPSIAPFSGLAGRQLSGAMDLLAKGSVEPLIGGFDLNLAGTADNLVFGTDVANKILAGRTQLSGRIARTEIGVEASAFQIANTQSRITADGVFSSTSADFTFSVALADLGLLSEKASGPLTATGTANGVDGPINIALNASVPTGSLAGRRLANAHLGFEGTLIEGDITGDIVGNAFLDGHRVDLSAGAAMQDGSNRLTDLNFAAAGTELKGDIYQGADGLMTGNLDLQSANISVAAALLLADAEGAINAEIELTPVEGKQTAQIAANARNIVFNSVKVGSADITTSIQDLLGVPALEGALNGADIVVSGLAIDTLSATANQIGDATSFDAKTSLQNGTNINLQGAIAPLTDGYRIDLDTAQLNQGALSAGLVRSTTMSVVGDAVTLEDATLNVGGGRITTSGTAGGALNLAIDVVNVPLSIANTVMPDLGLGGTLNGNLRVTGEASDPSISFEIAGRDINAKMISSYGITPLQIDASGSFSDDTLRLAALQANGPAGASLKASGTMPLVGSNGNLQVDGNVPLALANRTIGGRGTQLSGTVAIDARVSGSVTKPSFGGTISTVKAQIVDPLTNLRLQTISANAQLSGDRLVIENFNGSLATGGSVGASGAISLDAQAGFPAEIAVQLNSARYADGNLFVATASGQMTVTGSLLRDPLLSGDVFIENAEISVPDSFGADANVLEVDQISLPADVAETLRRVNIDTPKSTDNGSPSDLQLNVSVSAPNQIFVRGRGLDVELGGQVRLTGSANDIQPIGGFELIRGRLSILGQRVAFTSGNVTLVGTLDPYINLVAETDADDTRVLVTVEGPVSNLDIAFSSEPELPQDEVLSLLIFQRSVNDLSPLQLARLAAAAAELAGGSGSSLVESLRAATGLADLDVITDDDGNAALQAGAYLQDNVYVSVQAGAQGDSKVSIDLDITDSVKARGSASNDGETSIGLFYEQDY